MLSTLAAALPGDAHDRLGRNADPACTDDRPQRSVPDPTDPAAGHGRARAGGVRLSRERPDRFPCRTSSAGPGRTPTRCRLATPPAGSPPHLAALRLQELAQTRLNIVTFPSAAAATQAVLAANVSAAALGLSNVIDSLRDGRLSAIGIAAGHRFGLLPDIPVLDEAGIPLAAFIGRGVAVPVGTPANLVDAMVAAMRAVDRRRAFCATGRDERLSSGVERWSGLAEGDAGRTGAACPRCGRPTPGCRRQPDSRLVTRTAGPFRRRRRPFRIMILPHRRRSVLNRRRELHTDARAQEEPHGHRKSRHPA